MFQMPSTKSSTSFALFAVRSLAQHAEEWGCMFRQPPSKFINAAAGLLCWNIEHLEGSDRNGRLLLEQKRIDYLQQIWRYPRTPLLVTSPCVHIEQVWNAARWMHCSNPKFLKFWMTMLSPQENYHFLAGQCCSEIVCGILSGTVLVRTYWN